MNFTEFQNMAIRGHRDIDFVDVHINADIKLFIDPERISLSKHLFAVPAKEAIDDFFNTLCEAAARRDANEMYHLLSFGKEPNETHLGLSSLYSRGKGTTPEILMPIISDMIEQGLFDSHLITQLGDLHLWTPNFHYDRLSDLTTNIIRSVLIEYTYNQYYQWRLPLDTEITHYVPTWDVNAHEWVIVDCPQFLSGDYPTLLVPKDFVGQQMLSSPSELLYKYALKYRQQEHLDEQSEHCHIRTKRNGDETILPPTKRELYNLEVKGQPAKSYLRNFGVARPNIVSELHNGHKDPNTKRNVFMTDYELDTLLYKNRELAV